MKVFYSTVEDALRASPTIIKNDHTSLLAIGDSLSYHLSRVEELFCKRLSHNSNKRKPEKKERSRKKGKRVKNEKTFQMLVFFQQYHIEVRRSL